MSVIQERDARRSMAQTLGLDEETASRLTTDFLLSAMSLTIEAKERSSPISLQQRKQSAISRELLRRRSEAKVVDLQPGEPIRSSNERQRRASVRLTLPNPTDEKRRSIEPFSPLTTNDTDELAFCSTMHTDGNSDDDDNVETDLRPEGEDSGRRRSRLPSTFALKLGPELAGAILGDSVLQAFEGVSSGVLLRRPTVSEHHREVAGRRNVNFAKALMYHLQRQQAREDFGASKIAADAQEIQALRQLRSSQWFANVYLIKFQQSIWSACLHERAKRMLIKTLSPLIVRSVLRRRRNQRLSEILPTVDQQRPSVAWLMKSSQIVSKWPQEAVEKLRLKLKPAAFVEGCCVSYAGDPPNRCSILFVTSGHTVEIPSRADLLRVAPQRPAPPPIVSPPGTPRGTISNQYSALRCSMNVSTSSTDPLVAQDVLPMLFDSSQERLLNAPSSSDASASNTRNANNLSMDQMRLLSPQAIQLYQELQHCSSGCCLGDVPFILGQSRRRTLRAWTDTAGFTISFEAMQELMIQHLPPSCRADCLHAAKNIAKGQLAKQSKPSVNDLKSMHGVFAVWPLQVLSHVQSLLQPQINVTGEVVARDILHSSKLFITHTGAVQVESRPTTVCAELTLQNASAARIVQSVSTGHQALGVGGVVQTEFPLTTNEEWLLRSLVFSEMWVAPTSEVRKVLMQHKMVQQSLNVASEQLMLQYNAAALAYGNGPGTTTAALKQQLLHPNIIKSTAIGLKSSCQAFQHLQERALLRLAKVLRPRVTAAGEGLCVERTIPRGGMFVYSGTVLLQRTETSSSGEAFVKTVRELHPGTCVCFIESIVDSTVDFSALCTTSCIVLTADRHALLEAVSNGGRDFSSMYAFIERCEVLSGLKSAKAAEDSMRKKAKEMEVLEFEEQEKRLAATRELSLARAKAYNDQARKSAEEEELLKPKRRPMNISAQERIDHYRAAQRALHQMSVENRVFASMGNQLHQYNKNPEVEERLSYLADPFKVYDPVKRKDAAASPPTGSYCRNVSVEAGQLGDLVGTDVLSTVSGDLTQQPYPNSRNMCFATLDDEGRIVQDRPTVPHTSQASNTRKRTTPSTTAEPHLAETSRKGMALLPRAPVIPPPERARPEVLSHFADAPPDPSCVVSPTLTVTPRNDQGNMPKHTVATRVDDYHSREVRDRVDRICFRQPLPPPQPLKIGIDADRGTDTTEVSPRALSMYTGYGASVKDTPRLSELRVASTELPEVRSVMHWLSPSDDGSHQQSNHQHHRDTLPSSLRHSSAQRSTTDAPPPAMVRLKVEDDGLFLRNALRPCKGWDGDCEPPMPLKAQSARCAMIRKDINDKLNLLEIDDFEGSRTKHMVSHALRRPEPNLPPPKSEMKPVKVVPACGRNGVPVFGTTLKYVVDPFNSGRIHGALGLRSDGSHRVGRVLPRTMLHGAKNGFDALQEEERVQLVEKALSVGAGQSLEQSTPLLRDV